MESRPSFLGSWIFVYQCGAIVVLLVSVIGRIAVLWSFISLLGRTSMYIHDVNGDPKYKILVYIFFFSDNLTNSHIYRQTDLPTQEKIWAFYCPHQQ